VWNGTFFFISEESEQKGEGAVDEPWRSSETQDQVGGEENDVGDDQAGGEESDLDDNQGRGLSIFVQEEVSSLGMYLYMY